MISGTLTFFHEEGARRCLELSITLEMSETVSRRFVRPSRRHSPTITKALLENKGLPVIVGIGGPSGSGKTSLAHKMANIISCEVVSLESYYKSEQMKDFKFGDFNVLDLALLSKNIDDIKNCRRTKIHVFDLETGGRSGFKELEVSEDCGVIEQIVIGFRSRGEKIPIQATSVKCQIVLFFVVFGKMNLISLRPTLFSKARGFSISYCSVSLNHHKQLQRHDTRGDDVHKLKENQEFSIDSPLRIQKLIVSQPDPLLAKEIFDLASGKPGFRHSYVTFHSLILKLGRSHHFSLMQSVLSSLKSQQYPISPSLFTRIIQIYGDAKMPEKALKTFYTILEFNIKPSPKHLSRILEILVAQLNFIRPAFDLFRSAHKYDVVPNTESYNILMRAFCFNGDLSIAYSLLNQMFKRDVVPNVESYKILMQALCRKSQVNKAIDLLEDMLNKGFVPDTLIYTTLLNSLCRKTKLKEAYKLLCRMKVKGCNPDIVHYNTVILGFCRVGRGADACKVLDDMLSNGCLPNLVSYQTIVGGLCNQGMHDVAKSYLKVMISKGLFPHCSVVHSLIEGISKIGRIDDACEVICELLRHGKSPHVDTWNEILPRIYEAEDREDLEKILNNIVKIEMNPNTRIVDIGSHLEEYLIKKIKARPRRA